MTTNPSRERERGSALVIAALVTVILTLLGVSFLLMGETENKIAENERLSAQALYFAEAGVKQVKRWFDRPRGTTGYAWNLMNPPLNVIQRDLRRIDIDGPGPTAYVLTDGNAAGTQPYYKQGRDLNGDGIDDIFDRPYRPNVLDMLLGTSDGPDIRIDRDFSAAAKTFLNTLSDRLMTNFPNPAAGIRARISRIDVYAPPYLQIGGNWTRYGLATVAITAQILKDENGTERMIAARTIRAVLNETPYPGPFGPLHSCDVLNWNGSFAVHWGTATAVGDATNIPSNLNSKFAESISRSVPVSAKVEAYYDGSQAMFTTMKTTLEGAGTTIPDPWFRFIAGHYVYHPSWASPSDVRGPLPDTTDYVDHSDLFGNIPNVGCPDFDYETWKTVATSGNSDVYYYTWVSGDNFRLNGTGPSTAFATLTAGKTGLYFFDTKTASAPIDANGDGIIDNLTPLIALTGGWQGFRGMMYLNSDTFRINGGHSINATFTLPGEPYFDTNTNGVWDAGEPYINLNYTSVSTPTGNIRASATDNYGGSVMYNKKGSSFTSGADIWGVVYNNGQFDAQGNPIILGSLITKVGQTPSAGTADLYWDPKIADEWPPSDWDLPRVIITRYDSDAN